MKSRLITAIILIIVFLVGSALFVSSNSSESSVEYVP